MRPRPDRDVAPRKKKKKEEEVFIGPNKHEKLNA
jgi:hypothetical protein